MRTHTSIVAIALLLAACGPRPDPVHPEAETDEVVPTLVSLLRDEDPMVRQFAALALSRMGPDAVPPLVEMLSSENPDTRMDALYVLDKMGSDAAPAIPALVAMVRSPAAHDPNDVDVAILILGKLQAEEAIPHMIDLLVDPDLGYGAGKALGEMGPPAFEALAPVVSTGGDDLAAEAMRVVFDMNPEHFPDPLALATDPDPLTRAVGVRLLARSDEIDEAGIDAILAALGDEAEVVSRAAWDVVIFMDGDQALPILLRVIGGEDADQAFRAADLLGDMGEDAAEAVPALAAVLDHDDPGLASQAARSIGEIGVLDHAATLGLVAMLQDGKGGTPYTPLRALVLTGASDDVDVEVIASFLSSPALDVALLSARILGNVGPDAKPHAKAIETLVPRVAEDDQMTPESRLEAIIAIDSALVRIGADPSALHEDMASIVACPVDAPCPDDGTCSTFRMGPEELAPALDVAVVSLPRLPPDLGCGLLDAITELHEEAIPLLPVLRDLISSDAPSIREASLGVIAGIGPGAAEAAEDLVALVDDEDVEIAALALTTLGAIGAPEAWEPAIAAMTEPGADWMVTEAAMRCMQMLGPPPEHAVEAVKTAIAGGLGPQQAGLLEVLARAGEVEIVLDALDATGKRPELLPHVLGAIAILGPEAAGALPALLALLPEADMRLFGALAETIIAIAPSDVEQLDLYARSIEAEEEDDRLVGLFQFTDVVMNTRAEEQDDPETLEQTLRPLLEPHVHLIPVLVTLLTEGSMAERILATFTLGAFGPLASEHMAELLPNLHSENETLRMTTLIAITLLAGPWDQEI